MRTSRSAVRLGLRRDAPRSTVRRRIGPWGIQAHTSPVYVRVPGEELFSGAAASYMLTLVEGARTWLDTLATRPDPERFARVHKVIEDAKQHLHERLHKHGIKH